MQFGLHGATDNLLVSIVMLFLCSKALRAQLKVEHFLLLLLSISEGTARRSLCRPPPPDVGSCGLVGCAVAHGLQG